MAGWLGRLWPAKQPSQQNQQKQQQNEKQIEPPRKNQRRKQQKQPGMDMMIIPFITGVYPPSFFENPYMENATPRS